MKEVVVITGSNGLIGHALARKFAPLFHVVGLDNEAPRGLEPAGEHVHVDLAKEDSVETALGYIRAVHGDRIASFIHLASYYDFSGEPSPLYEEVTVRGTERVLRGLRDFQLSQFVFSSSMLVHEPAERGRTISEESPLLPKWDYPRSKVDTENLIRAQRGAIPSVILRIAGVYDDWCHSLPLANQIQRIYERKLIGHVFPGDTANGQAFVHLDDLIDAFALVVENRRKVSTELTLLIGEPETLSYEELQQTLARLIHREDWETQRIPKPIAKAGAWLTDQVPGEEPFIKPWMIDMADDHYALDISRARERLGWEPKRTLRTSLPRMVGALLADPIAWYRKNELEPPAWLEESPRRPTDAQPHPS